MKLILAGGAEVAITDYTSNSFLADVDTFLEGVNNYDTISRGLSEVSIQDDGGETVMAATGLTLDGVQIMQKTTGGFTAIYYFHGAKAATAEDEFSQVGRILMGVEA